MWLLSGDFRPPFASNSLHKSPPGPKSSSAHLQIRHQVREVLLRQVLVESGGHQRHRPRPDLVDVPPGDPLLLIRSDRQNLGLGRRLLADLLDVARRRGIRRVWGEVMAGNRNMLELTEAMGFHREPSGDRDLVRVAVRGAGPLDRPRPTLVTV